MTADTDTDIYESISEVNANQWNHVVGHSQFSSVFHRYEWLESLEEGTALEPRHVVVSKKGNPVAVFPNFVEFIEPLEGDLPSEIQERLPLDRLVSTMPGYGGPLGSGDYQEYLSSMFDTLTSETGSDVVYHLLKMNDLGYTRFGQFLSDRGYAARLTTCRIVLDLDESWEALVSNMDSSRRRAVQRANEQDARVEHVDPDLETIRETYTAYRRNMERIGGTMLPLSLFEALASNMPDRVMISKALVEGREVGRLVHLLDDEQSTVHYFFSAIGDEDDFEYHPSELLHGHAIQWGQENGYSKYDFGETTADFTDSLFHYKEQYGGEVVPTLQWEKGFAPVRWSAYRLGRALS